VLGFLNGVGTAWLGLPSFMMTLAMSMIADGLVMYIARGTIFGSEPPILSDLAFGAGPWHMPLITVPALLALALGFVVLRFTRFGRHTYTVGSNPVAAQLSGVRTGGVLIAAFTISGFTSGLAGLLFLGRAGSAQAGGTDTMLIACISAVVIGGTSLFGGRGGIANTVVGLLTLGVLSNGLNHLDVDTYAKDLIAGVILLGALLLNIAVARLRESR
jgi:ribose transport system permease protein